MGLKGNLSTINLADVFQVLSRGGSTGLLRIQAPEGPRFVEIQNGAISIAGRSSGRIMLGDLLLSRGLIDESGLQKALQSQRESGKMLGQALLDLNMVQMEQLEEALRFQIEEEVCELFTLETGDFDFLANASLDAKIAPAGGMVRLKLDPNGLLLEAARRADEWKTIGQTIVSQSAVFNLSATGTQVLKTGEGLSSEGMLLLRLVNDHRSVEAMVQKACLGRLLTNQMLIELLGAGMIEPLPLAGYEKITREHLKLNRIEEAQRLAHFMVEQPELKEKGQAILMEVEKARRVVPQTATATVSADPRIRSEVIRRNQPGLILKKDKSPLPLIIAAAVLLVAGAGAGVYFMMDGKKGEMSASKKSLDEVVVQANDQIIAGKYSDALELLRNFRSKDSAVQRLANEQYEKKQKEIEAKLTVAMDRFNNALAKGKDDEIKSAAELLEPLVFVNLDASQIESVIVKTRAAFTAYKERQASEVFKGRLADMKAAEKTKGGAELLENYRKLLAENPPESIAVQIRDEISRLNKARAEAQQRLKRAETSREIGDLESARMDLEQVQKNYANSDLATKATEHLAGLVKLQSDAQAKLDRVEVLLTQKKTDEAKNELVKLLDSRPPFFLTVRAMDVLHNLPGSADGVNAATAGLRDVSALADKQPAEARKKLDELLQKFPYAKPAVSATLKVQIDSQPEGVEVLLNGKPLPGRTPLVADVPVLGSVRLGFRKSGFATADIADYNCRKESINVYLDRLPVASRRMPIAGEDGVALAGEHCVSAGSGEAIVSSLPDFRIQHRVRLTDPKAQSEEKFTMPLWRGAVIAHGQALISRADKTLYRVDLLSGRMSRLTLEEPATSVPLPFASIKLPGKRLLGIATLHGLETFNFEDGKHLKSVSLGDETKRVPLGLAFDGERFYLPREDKLLRAFAGWDGEKKWEITADAVLAGPLAYSASKGVLAALADNGALLVLDAETGAKRALKESPAEKAGGVLASGDGFLVPSQGKAELIGADGKVFWTASIAGAPLLPPQAVKANEKDGEKALLVCHADGGEYFLSALHPLRGSLLWRARLSAKPLAFASDGNTVVVATDDAELTAYDFK